MTIRFLPILLLILCVPALSQTVTLVSPNGNERYPFNDTMDIRWSGVGPTIGVTIELSDDGGQTFTTITDSATGNLYRWPVPEQSGDRFRVRLSVTTQWRLARTFGVTPSNFVSYPSVAAIHPSGDTLALLAIDSVKFGNPIQTYVAATGELLQTMVYANPATVAMSVKYSPSGDLLAVAMDDGKVLIWEAKTGRLIRTINAYSSTAYEAVFSPDGEYLATIGDQAEKGVIKIWQVSNGAIASIPRVHGGQTLSFSPDGSLLVSSSNDGWVKLWNGKTVNPVDQWFVNNALASVAISPDNALLAASGLQREIYLYDVQTKERRMVLSGHTTLVRSMEFSADGRYLLSGGFDSTARIWDVQTGASILSMSGANTWTYSVDFTSRGQVLTGSRVGRAHLWDISLPSSDTSDENFRIIPQRLALRDIDFGRVVLGTRRDSTLEAYICNEETVPIRLQEISFVNDPANEFSVAAAVDLPMTIPPGECRPLAFGFAPSSVATRNVLVRFVIDDDTLYAEFQGEGVSTTGVDLTGAAGLSLRALPNPASGITTLEYSLPRPGAVALKLVDAQGTVLWQQREESVGAGTQRALVDLSGMTSGHYWLLLESDGYRLRRKLLVIE